PGLLGVSAPFAGFKETPVRVSSTSLVSYDNNRYSVDASAVGRAVMLRAYADRIVVVNDGVVVGEHQRRFSRHEVSYEPWHYIGVLQRKPGALRNGAPFKGWELPEPLTVIRDALGARADGDRQFVGILAQAAVYGLDAVTAACREALSLKTPSRDVVLNILCRSKDDPFVPVCSPIGHLPTLTAPPLADCRRYDALLSGGVTNAKR
ncbi:MAG: Mu transposase domain-containing protein, partial [Armatimonadota bacterium]